MSIIYNGKFYKLFQLFIPKTLVIGIRSTTIIRAKLIVSCNFQSLTKRYRLLVDTRLESTVKDTNSLHSEQLK